jgi:choline dehydrogenase
MVRALLGVAAALLLGASAHEHGGTREEFDFVIVGGGLAGSILANRLSESGRHSVLVLNVAGAPPKAYSGPVLLTDEFIMRKNLTADDGLRARIMQPGYKPMPAFSTVETGSSPARWLGGSTLVSLSLYLRDHPEAFDAWGQEWRYPHVRKYFNRVEDGSAIKDGDYGQHGAYKITGKPAYVHPLTNTFLAAAAAEGLPLVSDLNTQKGPGVGITPVSQRADGTKAHAFDAFLKPALGRKNLVIRSGARADRLLVDEGHHCRGVAYRQLASGEDRVVYAKREVILSSGYIYSPRLLFLSGIGDKEDLKRVGLEVKHHLPAVGKHLTAARYTPLSWRTETPTLSEMMGSPISPEGQKAVPEAFGSALLEATARTRSQAAREAEPEAERPDIAAMFMPLYYAPKSAPLQYSLQGEEWPLKTNAYTLLVTLGETKAKGAVTFPTASPDESPLVTHEALTHPHDLRVAEEAVAWARKIGGSAQFNATQGAVDNGAGAADMFSAVYDGRGTCRMGSDGRDSVVSRDLKVHGIEGLRVVDGSVIPQASPYLAQPEVLLIAERAAELLLHEHLGFDVRAEKASTGLRRAEVQVAEAPAVADSWTVSRLRAILGEDLTLMQAVNFLGGSAPEQGLSSQGRTGPSYGLALVAALLMGAAVAATAFDGYRRRADETRGKSLYFYMAA